VDDPYDGLDAQITATDLAHVERQWSGSDSEGGSDAAAAEGENEDEDGEGEKGESAEEEQIEVPEIVVVVSWSPRPSSDGRGQRARASSVSASLNRYTTDMYFVDEKNKAAAATNIGMARRHVCYHRQLFIGHALPHIAVGNTCACYMELYPDIEAECKKWRSSTAISSSPSARR
jgi:hypothetical protein